MNFLRHRRVSEESEDIAINDRNKSRKPPNTAFRQQRLKAWQPILTPKTVLPLLVVLVVILIPIGVGLLFATINVEQLTIDYSRCGDIASSEEFSEIPKRYYNHHFKKSVSSYENYANPRWLLVENDDSNTCTIQFDLPNSIKPPIYLYYKLTNFYQNHREYVNSYDLDQLSGKPVAYDDIDSDCKPLKHIGDKIIYPCGLIANSYFNDTVSSLTYINRTTNSTYELSNKDIAWGSDKHRFKKTQYNASDIVPPPNWMKKFPDGYTDDNIPDISDDEFFQNWMRTALLPSFMKLAAKNTTQTLELGTYSIDLELNYPVSVFGGTKSFVLSTNSVIGGRNLSLGICYIIVGGICLIFFVIFLLKQLVSPRKIGTQSMNSIKFGETEYHFGGDEDRSVL